MLWFLQAALLLAQAGYKILPHGMVGSDDTRGKIVSAANAIGIPICTSAASAAEAVAEHGVAYLPIAAMSGQLHRLHMLYGLFENVLRSTR